MTPLPSSVPFAPSPAPWLCRLLLGASLPLAALLGGCSSSSLGPNCQAWVGSGGCCFQVAKSDPSATRACQETASAVAQASGSQTAAEESQCQAALSAARQLGECGSGGSTGGLFSTTGSSGASGTSGSITQTRTCARYVTCVSDTDAQALPATLAAYGPQGTCWTSSVDAATCDTACSTGLEQAYRATGDAVCGECSLDSDCGPGAPVCDPRGQCECSSVNQICSTDQDCCNGLSCESGGCQCPAGEGLCGGACVPLDTAYDCGACGVTCSPNETCNAGQCTCSGSVCDGACLDTTSNPENCGACGNACPCQEACENGACVATTLSLCGDLCTNLTTDATNCGSCGNVCADGMGCTAGSCACPEGTTLCAEGCVDLSSDAANCGSCGTACASAESNTQIASCGGGRCLLGWSFDQVNGLAVDSQNLYFTSAASGGVSSMPIGGGAATALPSGLSGPSGDVGGGGVALSGSTLFWSNFDYEVLRTQPTSGGSATTLASKQLFSAPGGANFGADLLVADGTNLAWPVQIATSCDQWGNTCYGLATAPQTGGPSSILVPDAGAVTWIASDGSSLYWCTPLSFGKASFSDGTSSLLVSGSDLSCALGPSSIYWADGEGFHSAGLDGSNPQLIHGACDAYPAIYGADSQFLYVNDGCTTGDIVKVPLDGSPTTTLIVEAQVTSFSMTSAGIFWTDGVSLYQLTPR